MVTRIYANAVAKFNEGKLLDGEKLRRLADAEFPDAVKMLCDYGYGGGTVDEKSYDVDAFISRETAALIEYALNDSPCEYLARVLTNRFLYGNAKAYYKARLSGKANSAAVYSMPDGEVREGIERGDYAALPQHMADALVALDSAFAESAPDPKLIDNLLTKAAYADSTECAQKSKSKALIKFVAGEIDVANIFSALRARALKVSETALNALIIEGGIVSADDIIAIFRAENPVKAIVDTPYDFIVYGLDEPDLPRFEARADDYLSEIWERGAEDMQSLSPFVSYFIAQLGEYKTVKMILTCLKNNARSEILPRLRKAGGSW